MNMQATAKYRPCNATNGQTRLAANGRRYLAVCSLDAGHAGPHNELGLLDNVLHRNAPGLPEAGISGERCNTPCGSTCPEEPAWICTRPAGHQGRHESAGGGDWYRTEAEYLAELRARDARRDLCEHACGHVTDHQLRLLITAGSLDADPVRFGMFVAELEANKEERLHLTVASVTEVDNG